jgi:hypothetical protein
MPTRTSAAGITTMPSTIKDTMTLGSQPAAIG